MKTTCALPRWMKMLRRPGETSWESTVSPRDSNRPARKSSTGPSAPVTDGMTTSSSSNRMARAASSIVKRERS
jgi:hypothetical protein